jgi:membrane protease YdiL (CAAX protease family)
MKYIASRFFRWRPSYETLVPAVTGLIVISLSVAMIPARGLHWLSIVIRDIVQIFVVGILFPLIYMQRSGNRFAEFGLSLRKWYILLPVNLVLGALVLLMFLSKSPPLPDFRLNAPALWKAGYALCAVFFELVFFYGFLRTLFERAFGIVPAIVITACLYAFHHMGFQPEYGKLFLVGLVYATVYRLGNSALLIFPFFLGVGGTYDVLVQSQAVSPVLYPEIRTVYLAVLILATLAWAWNRTRT